MEKKTRSFRLPDVDMELLGLLQNHYSKLHSTEYSQGSYLSSLIRKEAYHTLDKEEVMRILDKLK